MIKFRNISTTCCPVCGCDTVVSEYLETSWFTKDNKRDIWEHVNGGRQEVREFLCGYKVRYSPNFLRDVEQNPCLEDPLIIKAKKEADQISEQLLNFIETVNLPEDELKCSIKNRLKDIVSAKDIYNSYKRAQTEVKD